MRAKNAHAQKANAESLHTDDVKTKYTLLRVAYLITQVVRYQFNSNHQIQFIIIFEFVICKNLLKLIARLLNFFLVLHCR